ELLGAQQRVQERVAPALQPPGARGDELPTSSCGPVRPGRPAHSAPCSRRCAAQGGLRLEAVVAPSEPRPAGRVAAPLAAQIPERGPVAVLVARFRSQLEAPSGGLDAPAEVGVLTRADALVEASDLLERGGSD